MRAATLRVVAGSAGERGPVPRIPQNMRNALGMYVQGCVTHHDMLGVLSKFFGALPGALPAYFVVQVVQLYLLPYVHAHAVYLFPLAIYCARTGDMHLRVWEYLSKCVDLRAPGMTLELLPKNPPMTFLTALVGGHLAAHMCPAYRNSDDYRSTGTASTSASTSGRAAHPTCTWLARWSVCVLDIIYRNDRTCWTAEAIAAKNFHLVETALAEPNTRGRVCNTCGVYARDMNAGI
jgi:hypothetical protein